MQHNPTTHGVGRKWPPLGISKWPPAGRTTGRQWENELTIDSPAGAMTILTRNLFKPVSNGRSHGRTFSQNFAKVLRRLCAAFEINPQLTALSGPTLPGLKWSSDRFAALFADRGTRKPPTHNTEVWAGSEPATNGLPEAICIAIRCLLSFPVPQRESPPISSIGNPPISIDSHCLAANIR